MISKDAIKSQPLKHRRKTTGQATTTSRSTSTSSSRRSKWRNDCGKNPVLEALRAGREINKVWVAEGVKKTGIQELIELAKEQGVLVQFVPKQKVDKLAENHQGIVASVAAYDYAELDDLFAVAKAKMKIHFS